MRQGYGKVILKKQLIYAHKYFFWISAKLRRATDLHNVTMPKISGPAFCFTTSYKCSM